MGTPPRLSIGLPVCNAELTVSKSLDTLLEQSYGDFELIISDNASTDRTAEICRRYERQDPRVRYFRQARNIGLAANHNFVLERARGELFKWASGDDVYGPDLLERCVAALDADPRVVLAHSWTAKIDRAGNVTHALEYPLATSSLRAPERFESMLCDSWTCDDIYGVVWTRVLRRVMPHGSHHHADRTVVTELSLHGPFYQVPDWLYFRRDHDEPAGRARPTVRSRCANMDPRRASRLRNPAARLYGEYVGAYVAAIHRAPLSPADRRACYRHLTTWLFRRTGDWRARQAEAGVAKRTPPAGSAPRVGLFGHIGSGNLGNDASVEVVLTYLQASHTGAVVDAMCKSPDRLRRQYGVEAIPLLWYSRYEEQSSGVPAIVLKVLGKGVDAFRTASWVRRHDVVIVPGTGLLESSLPLRPWHMPYALFLLCTSGRLFGTKIALVSVGATTVNQRATRWLLNSAARLAFYRSYRDVPSWDAMRASGIDPADGRIYPDLVFGLDTPTGEPGDPRTVGVGVMAYHGGNDDRREADRIHARYLGEMKRFIRWLVDGDRRVRLFWGDDADGSTVEEILADVRAHRPDLQPGQVVAERCSSLRELIAKMASVGSVVATRYHNVVCALKLSKPTISIGYGSKHEALMADMGMSEFALSARALHSDELIARFGELERRSPELRRALAERSDTNGALVGEQFSMLSSVLFSEHDPCRGVGMRPPAA